MHMKKKIEFIVGAYEKKKKIVFIVVHTKKKNRSLSHGRSIKGTTTTIMRGEGAHNK